VQNLAKKFPWNVYLGLISFVYKIIEERQNGQNLRNSLKMVKTVNS
jgi:hypothetical protein